MKFEMRKINLAISSSLLAGLFLMTGCASLHTNTVAREQRLPADAAIYVVDIHSGIGKPTRWEGQVTKGMTVQSALEASGALAKIKNPDIELTRPVPESGTVLRMTSEMQPGKKIVKYEHDYAIHAGDHLVIKPLAKPNPLEKMVGNMF